MEGILEWALKFEPRRALRPALLEWRAAVATVFTYCFFARGATGTALLDEHVRRGPAGELLITLDHEKGRGRSARSRLLTVPAGSIAGLDELLSRWLEFRGKVRGDDSFYALPFECAACKGARRVGFPSTANDTWLQMVLLRMGVEAPAGETWTGHSLRKGAASGAAAIMVGLDRICHMGGWKIHGGVVHDYIDPTCPATPAAYRFYGWLLPAAMRN